MRELRYTAVALIAGFSLLWIVTNLLLPALFQAGAIGAEGMQRIIGVGIVGGPILGWVIVELIIGRIVWWPYPMTRRKDAPFEYWFTVGLKVALLVLIAVSMFRQ
jgi:hypothetical protein